MIRGLRSRHNEMPIPTRTAPKPPGNPIDQRNNTWSNNDPFGSLTIPQPIQKKKPPPRPPPPRIKKDNIQNNLNKQRKPTRPTELITNLFGIRSAKQPQIKSIYSHNRPSCTNGQSNNSSEGTVSLIDLSPPGSPTFTIRSSSDGVSIDSFGSDGNSNPSVLTSSSGNTSQNESAFEDDFDFFGSLSKHTIQHDPWKQNTPFDSLSQKKIINTSLTNGIKHVGESSFISYNNEQLFTPMSATNSVLTMPTIIRARPPKPPAPKLLTTTSLAPTVPNFNVPSSAPKVINSSCTFNENLTWPTSISATLSEGNFSPPMPSIPPPSPPPEYLAQIECPTTQKKSKPQGVALYDFEATQPGDLSLKEGDIVFLTKKINDEWLEGQIGNHIGMFPANFINITVPLNECSSDIVNALYTFNGETWEDLNFEEGAKIKVLSKISDDWLYGEYQGKKGQFPTNYIDRVPSYLPKYL
ncbi:SH3 domain-containing protein 19-like isoform X1 [Cotesia glomerata]|uniref:SH3 domain-containing protein n=2 Tax=Cotesia glomerata TaxID=32391 RepID=A0AAV7I8Z4_COTGL|nr:SH3 domain-containing protein 19-like isoform X1 [Cotesia glomerata]KAH0546645.1 hypothetical protein KQX54_012931 [Cotesia glomerata]